MIKTNVYYVCVVEDNSKDSSPSKKNVGEQSKPGKDVKETNHKEDKWNPGFKVKPRSTNHDRNNLSPVIYSI